MASAGLLWPRKSGAAEGIARADEVAAGSLTPDRARWLKPGEMAKGGGR